MSRTQNLVDWIMAEKSKGNIPCKCTKCEHEWGYTGEKRGKQWVTCPKCKRKDRLNRLRLDR